MRIVGDRMDVAESYIPLDGSARSWELIAESIRSMPGARPGGGSSVARIAPEDIAALASAIVRASSGAAGVALAQQARADAGSRRTVGRQR
jgi:hypothetical protein